MTDERLDTAQPAAEPAAAPAKCVICNGSITHRSENGDDHCRNGHVYARDYEQFECGPLPVEMINRWLQDKARPAPSTASPE